MVLRCFFFSYSQTTAKGRGLDVSGNVISMIIILSGDDKEAIKRQLIQLLLKSRQEDWSPNASGFNENSKQSIGP